MKRYYTNGFTVALLMSWPLVVCAENENNGRKDKLNKFRSFIETCRKPNISKYGYIMAHANAARHMTDLWKGGERSETYTNLLANFAKLPAKQMYSPNEIIESIEQAARIGIWTARERAEYEPAMRRQLEKTVADHLRKQQTGRRQAMLYLREINSPLALKHLKEMQNTTGQLDDSPQRTPTEDLRTMVQMARTKVAALKSKIRSLEIQVENYQNALNMLTSESSIRISVMNRLSSARIELSYANSDLRFAEESLARLNQRLSQTK